MRFGKKIQLIRQRVTLYLTLLQLPQETVTDLTEDILGRILKDTQPENKYLSPFIVSTVMEVLAKQKITPDKKYLEIFSDAYAPPLCRTPRGYLPFDPHKNHPHSKNIKFKVKLRSLVFMGLILLSTMITCLTITTALSKDGLTPLEWAIIILCTLLSVRGSMSLWTAIVGFFLSLLNIDTFKGTSLTLSPIAPGTRIALVMPVYNEETPEIFAALRAMYEAIDETGQLAHFDIYILSDSTREKYLTQEEISWAKLCHDVHGFGKIFYRRRKLRIHKKSGNIGDFCRRWGKNYEYMIPLDADSIVGGETLVRMVNIMESKKNIGILQTATRTINQTSLIARLTQFSNYVYDQPFSVGISFWQRDEASFWGRNAILRMEPFIKYCGLPRLPGKPPFAGEIMSHDFVEGALMRRAGWEVWLAPGLKDTYESPPPDFMGEIKRDKRWCQGNILHLRLLFLKGITNGSRFIFLNGNLLYFSSLMCWLTLLLVTFNFEFTAFQQAAPAAPTQLSLPGWTLKYDALSIFILKVILISAALMPRVFSFILIILSPGKKAGFGNILQLSLSMILETILSAILTPLRMIFHAFYVIINLIGQECIWETQLRYVKNISFQETFQTHGPITVGALIWGATFLAITPKFLWIQIPVILPLVLSIPISIFYSYSSAGVFLRKQGLLLTPAETRPSPILRRYQALLNESKDR